MSMTFDLQWKNLTAASRLSLGLLFTCNRTNEGKKKGVCMFNT